jgi:bacillithiol biosynthesis cysteine-adding enzyme BshC
VINPATLFSVIISGLFSRYGLIILDPSHSDLRGLLVNSVLFDMKNSGAVKQAVKKTGAMLEGQGYHKQLNLDENSTDFFVVKSGTRHKVLTNGKGQFIFDDDKYREEEFTQLLRKNYKDISPNVVLRPLFQDTILPVIATVCGPGEISYFAQLKEVYDLAGIKTGVLYPRFSATIIENKIIKSMKKTGITFEDFGQKKQHVINRKTTAGFGAEIDNMLQEFENDIFIKMQELKSRIISSNLDVRSSFDRIERNLGKETSVLKKKIYSELKSKNTLLGKNIDKIYMNVFPEGSMQERTANIFNFINKYDFCLLDSIYDIIDPESSSHKFIVLNGL